jgi:hypothetical protein
VATDFPETTDVEYGDVGILSDRTYILNFSQSGGNLIQQASYEGNTVPAGYGITVFPYLRWVLRKIFEKMGYELQTNFFDTDVDFKQLCLLNTCADAIVKGEIRYKDLLPAQMKVGDFLESICKKFNCMYFVDTTKMTAEIKFLDEVLGSSEPSADLSMYLDGGFTQKFTEKKKILLRCKKDLEYTKSEVEKHSDFLKKHEITEKDEADLGVVQPVGHILFRKANRVYYNRYAGRQMLHRIGTDYFDYEGDGKLAEEVIDSGDESVPVIRYNHAPSYVPSIYFAPVMVAFAGTRRHVYTVVERDGAREDESVPDQKIMFCFKGLYYLYNGDGWHFAGYHGTPFAHNNRGIKVRQTGMQNYGEDGIFERFWKKTDEVKRTRMNEISGTFRMRYAEFRQLRFDKVYLFGGTRVMIKSMKYSFKDDFMEEVEMELLTV